MNTAAPDPSDKSIAQAFREYLPAAEHADTQCLMSNIVERAREIDASAPAAAVGGEPEYYAPDALAACIESHIVPMQLAGGLDGAVTMVRRAAAYLRMVGTPWFCEEHPDKPMGHDGCKGAGVLLDAVVPLLLNKIRFLNQRISDLTHTYGFLAESALAGDTPAAPVGGFVVVPMEPTLPMLDAFCAGAMSGQPRDGYTAMLAASPVAQSSAKDGVRGESELRHDYSDNNGNNCIVCGATAWDSGTPCPGPKATTAAGLVDVK